MEDLLERAEYLDYYCWVRWSWWGSKDLEVACVGRRATRVLHPAREYEEPRQEALEQLRSQGSQREKLAFPGPMALRQIEAFHVPAVRRLRGVDPPLLPAMVSPALPLVVDAPPLHRCRDLEFAELLPLESSVIEPRRYSALRCSIMRDWMDC